MFQLFAKISMIHNHVTSKFVNVLPHGLTMAQFSILHHLYKRPGVEKTPLELANHFLLSKPSIGEALDKLAKKGFVTLKKNQNDGRSKVVSVAPAGVEAHHEAVAAIMPFLVAMREAVGAETLLAASDILYPIREWLREQR
ncbi:MAG: MarR family transcriptional regulator [Verrucomicrobiota bacterium JB022]|nr:MarR family transcriptional regulator [Verrucomicrobiota bacterium JB022]